MSSEKKVTMCPYDKKTCDEPDCFRCIRCGAEESLNGWLNFFVDEHMRGNM